MKNLLSLTAAGLIIAISSVLWEQTESQVFGLDLPSLTIIGGSLALASAVGLSVGNAASSVLPGIGGLLPGLGGLLQGLGGGNRRVVPLSQLQNVQGPFRVVGFTRTGRSVDGEETVNDNDNKPTVSMLTDDEGLAWMNGIQLQSEIMRVADPAECYQRIFCDMAATSEGYKTIRPMLGILDKDRVPPTVHQQLSGDVRQMLRRLEVAFQIGGVVKSEEICESIYQCPKSGPEIETDTSVIKKELDELQNI